MNGTSALLTALFCSAAASWLAAAPAVSETTKAADAGNDHPNVILILVDDQGYGDLACHGNPVLKTPNLDALWSASVRLTNFHVSPVCSPTRSALLTGRHCRKVGVHGMNGTAQHLSEEAATMGDIFSNSGYVTGIFGKWHLGDRYPLRPMDRGFATSVVFPDGAVSTIPDYWGNDYFDDVYLRNGKPQPYKGYCTDVWFNLAIEFIETNKDRPFFCYLPTNAAHSPYIVPERYAEPYRNDPRRPNPEFSGMIANLDENVGRLRSRLAALGLGKNTILIFMTDNGTAAGNYNAGMRGRKGSPYDGGHRVPCFLHHPAGGLIGGRDVGQLTAHVDILPTLVDLCRLQCEPAKPAFDGKSLARLLTGQGNPVADRVLVESFQRVVMTDRWRLVNQKELYDIRTDPAQGRDVAEEFPDVVTVLKKTLDEYLRTEDHRPHYVVVGSDLQNPVTLTGEDWQAGPLIYQYWMTRVPRHAPSQVWNLQVAQAGRYRVALRRWPKETGTPINAVLPEEKWCHRMLRCDALAAVEARIRVADAEHAVTVTDEMPEAEFTVELAVGPATLKGWFVDGANNSWAACYVYVERM
jgi:arylsulfatase A-like enzyme